MANMSFVRGLKIPVPQIETQRKIVSLLDKFEAINSSFEEGLPAEIEAREKQYAYYRDKLLTFEEAK
jgi:type I restriction enzyme S subunit